MNLHAKLGTLPTWSLFGGCVLVFLGERVAGVGTARIALDLAGVALLFASLGSRIVLLLKSPPDRKSPERKLFLSTLLVLASVALYALSTDEVLSKLGGEPGSDMSIVLARLWPIVLVLGSVPLFLIETAYRPMRKAQAVESARLGQAMAEGASLALAAAFLFTANYLSSEHDVQVDYSYFRTASPSQATLGMVSRLESKLMVHLFFPKANEVLEQVKGYLAPLEAASEKVVVEVHDRFLEPELAKKFSVRKEGAIVLEAGERHEKIHVGDELKKAKRVLRQLDRRFAEKFTKVTSPIKVAYRTVNHGEAGSGAEGTQTIRALEQVLKITGYKLKALGVKDSLGGHVPGDCALLVIIGPRHPFLPEEVEAIQAYLKKGGKILIALDPGVDSGLKSVLDTLGLKFDDNVLVNDRIHLRRFHTNADRALLVTVSYSSHPSVETLHKAGKVPVFLLNAGSLAKAGNDSGKQLKIRFPLRSMSGTFEDKDRDFELDSDKGERRRSHNLMAVVESRNRSDTKNDRDKKEDVEATGLKAVVLSDSDALTDQVLGNLGNLYLASDIARWLAGVQGITGAVESGEDVPVEHTREDDLVWFYGTVFLVPAMVLAGGLFYSNRRRKRRAGT